MSVEVQVPQLGESVTEAVITRWLKSDGDTVAVDEPLCELESDKATLDLPSPASGTLRVAKQSGETVKVGEIIARIEEAAAKAASAVAATPVARTKPQHAKGTKVEARPAATAMRPATVASPAARRVAEESGVDVANLEGSGRGGRVTKPDVVAAAQAKAPPPAAKVAPIERPAAQSPAAKAPTPASRAAGDDEERVAMTPLRRTIARRLVEAQHTAAILTTFNEVDMSSVMALRGKYKDAFAERHGVSLGFMSFFSRACVLALQEIREVNARIEGDEIVYSRGVHLGIAASTDRGLVVPVVKNADRLGMAELEREIGRLADLARAGKLSMEDLSGGTFTISNGGVFGSLLSTPILNPPQSGILGMHKIEKRPIVVGDDIVIRPMMYVALSYDHRIVDGRGAVTFLVRVKERLESPERLLLDL
jgi:2-oxoglutarate dehydrogenase E2 component (dihydrolipoamide succinyltransferase)